MAEEKTKKYFVRLVRGFPMAGHRRAGISFETGPTPQEVELTGEQVKLIKADPSLEFVSGKDAKKIVAATEDVDSVAGTPAPGTGRNYNTGDAGTATEPPATPAEPASDAAPGKE